MKKNSPVKVLVVGPSLSGLKGGQVTHMKNISRIFSDNPRYKIDLFFSSKALENFEFIWMKGFRLILTVARFPFNIPGIDIVHINSSFDNKALVRDVFIMFWCVLLKKKFVVQYHGGLQCNTFIENLFLFKIIWKKLSGFSFRILVLTDEQCSGLIGTGLKNIEKTNNFVDIPDFRPNKLSIFTFIFVGRIIREKGVFEIVDAICILQEKLECRMVFYGDGRDRVKLVEIIKKRGLAHIIEWRGLVDDQGKRTAYCEANGFLLPSCSEGMPYSVLEAMSYGIPVICSRAGSLPALVNNEKTGLLVSARDPEALALAMNRLMVDKDMYALLSKNSRYLISKKYSLNAMRVVFENVWR